VDHEAPQPPPGTPAPGGDLTGNQDWPLRGGTPDWVDEARWLRMCAVLGEDGPPDPMQALYDDPDSGAPPDWEQEPFEVLDARAEAAGAEYAARVTRLAAAGLDSWAHVRGEPPAPGPVTGLAGGFGQGRPLDDAAPCTPVSALADEASGEDRAFTGVNDDQLMGLIGTRARLISRQHWEQVAVVAEFIRRRPEPGCKPVWPGRMPKMWNEHAVSELAAELHLAKMAAAYLMGVSLDLTAKLPRTSAALRDGIIDWQKAKTIARSVFTLTPAQARKAEDILFSDGHLETMTHGMIRDRVARAVMEVDPDAARKRREEAAKDKRVEVTPEFSGNSKLSGRELPPGAVAVASQNLDARARELRLAGVPGGIDALRALALLEKLGAIDPLDGLRGDGTTTSRGGVPGSRDGTGDADAPDGSPAGGTSPGPGGAAGDTGDGSEEPSRRHGRITGDPDDGSGDDAGGTSVPTAPLGGLGANVNLTVPLSTARGLEDRPGTLSRVGPIDAALARDLLAAAARDPRTKWCITVTGPDHRPVAHACGRPPPRRPHRTPAGDHGPPGTGTIRLNIPTGTGIPTDLVFNLEPLAGPCDHKHQAKGHDPGRKLKHLTGILNESCTFPPCRCAAHHSDYEHSKPHDKGGKTCLCQAGPVCRRNHRDKQSPGWHLEEAGKRGWFKWTTPSRRTYLSRPTQYAD
jgi:hypothetical protein